MKTGRRHILGTLCLMLTLVPQFFTSVVSETTSVYDNNEKDEKPNRQRRKMKRHPLYQPKGSKGSSEAETEPSVTPSYKGKGTDESSSKGSIVDGETTITSKSSSANDDQTTGKGYGKGKGKGKGISTPIPPPHSPPIVLPGWTGPAAVGFGDPHMITYDRLGYDCQGRGDFVFARALDYSLEVQGRFTSPPAYPEISITTAMAAVVQGFGKVELVTTKESMPNTAFIGSCPLNLLVNGVIQNLSAGYISSGLVVETDVDKVDIYFGSSDLRLTITTLPFLDECFLNVFIGIPENTPVIGLLGGNPNGIVRDDWQIDSQTFALVPIDNEGLLGKTAYDYCTKTWCIRDSGLSLFTTPGNPDLSKTCDFPFPGAIDTPSAPQNIVDICGGNNLACLIDGIIGGETVAQGAIDVATQLEELDSRTVSPTSGPPTFNLPTRSPTIQPNSTTPTGPPFSEPTGTPTLLPTFQPSTQAPDGTTTNTPIQTPTLEPISSPTFVPTSDPSEQPTSFPTGSPTIVIGTPAPTNMPTKAPSDSPSLEPTDIPSMKLSLMPTNDTTQFPTESKAPSASPTFDQSATPSMQPTSSSPSISPSQEPTAASSTSSPSISNSPTTTTGFPTISPSSSPSSFPTRVPSHAPTTVSPTLTPSAQPSERPTSQNTAAPIRSPSSLPSASPTKTPTHSPSTSPSASPTMSPTRSPSSAPSKVPTTEPVIPSASPSTAPSSVPTVGSTAACEQIIEIDILGCLLEDGNSCFDSITFDRSCSMTAALPSISFSYFNPITGSCDTSSNGQGSTAQCADLLGLPFPIENVDIGCRAGLLGGGQDRLVTPSRVDQGEIFVVTLDDDRNVNCTFGQNGENYQWNLVDVDFLSGETVLNLGDTFGALRVESCFAASCRRTVELSVEISNLGGSQASIEINRLEAAVNGGQPSSLLDQINGNLVIGSGSVEIVMVDVVVDWCTDDTPEIIIVAGTDTQDCSAQDDLSFQLVDPPLAVVDQFVENAVDGCNVLDYVIADDSDYAELDIFGNGYSAGDVYSWHGGELSIGIQEVGTSSGRCIALPDTTVDIHQMCTMEFQLDDGSLVLQGVFYKLVAIGGTGCYSQVKGYLELEIDPLGLGRYAYDFHGQDNDSQTCPTAATEALFSSPWTGDGILVQDNVVDWRADGTLSSGDVYVFDDISFTTNAGVQGFLEGECMILFDPRADDNGFFNPYCVMTFTTAAGNDVLTVQGSYNNMVITAALGCFSGASGIVSGSSIRGGGGGRGSRYDLFLDDNADHDLPAFCSSGLFDDLWTEAFGELYVNYIFEPNDEQQQQQQQGGGGGDNLFTPGDAYVFHNKDFMIPSAARRGAVTGRCYILPDSSHTYCNMVFTITGEGSLAVQGFFGGGETMVVIGGSGCFRNTSGTVQAEETPVGFTYAWSLEEDL